MRKQDCEYCADEKDCKSKKHSIDCIFCECQDGYETNIVCERCNHDLCYCTCSEEQQKKDFDGMLHKLANKLGIKL